VHRPTAEALAERRLTSTALVHPFHLPNGKTSFVLHKNSQQESRAVARKPRDAAAFFSVESSPTTFNIHCKFNPYPGNEGVKIPPVRLLPKIA